MPEKAKDNPRRLRRIGVEADHLSPLLSFVSKLVTEVLEEAVEDSTVADLIRHYETLRQAIMPQTGEWFALRLPPASTLRTEALLEEILGETEREEE